MGRAKITAQHMCVHHRSCFDRQLRPLLLHLLHHSKSAPPNEPETHCRPGGWTGGRTDRRSGAWSVSQSAWVVGGRAIGGAVAPKFGPTSTRRHHNPSLCSPANELAFGRTSASGRCTGCVPERRLSNAARANVRVLRSEPPGVPAMRRLGPLRSWAPRPCRARPPPRERRAPAPG